ncbi:MAG: hypothetical protein L0229_11360 [Blastocatellia bacterium]|nr:hypothetical protein [Blastocatellia bacterium]
MDFPQSLAPWAQHLSIFPEEVSIALGRLAQRISLAIGPLRSHAASGEGDPDGFDGLAARGPYERLLASEWLLADEMPEEFARRAVMGEHAFLKIGRSEPAGSRVSLALFDSGPNQMGAPRIAHIAALIALARRAEAANAQFGWSILQQPRMPIFPGVTTSEVLQLLDARSLNEATDDDIEAWMKKVEDWQDLDDLWIVGGPHTANLPASAGISHLCVRDAYDPDARLLMVSVRGVSALPKEIGLELPEERLCSRLLRDPFSDVSAEPVGVKGKFAPRSNLIFAASGTKLFARSEQGSVIAFPVPNSPSASPGQPRLYQTWTGRQVDAAGRIGRSTAVVTAQDGMIDLRYYGGRNHHPPEGRYICYNRDIVYKSGDSAPLQPCLRLPMIPGSQSEALVVDGAGSLFRLTKLENHATLVNGKLIVGQALIVATNVLAIATIGSRIVCVGKEWPDDEWRIMSIGADLMRMSLPFEGAPAGAFFGTGFGLADNKYGLLALWQTALRWSIITSDGISPKESSLLCPADARAVGIARMRRESGKKDEPALIVLESDGRSLALVSHSRRQPLLTAAAPITHVTASHAAPRIAYSTAEGEVVIYSLTHRAAICRYLPTEDS